MLQDRMNRLTMACYHGHMDIVNELISNGTDVNEKDGVSYILDNDIVFDNRFNVFGMLQKGMNSLMRACSNGHLDIVNVLIDNGADVNDKDNVSSNLLSLLLISHVW
jgi:ankyrin repeat protein